MAKLEWDKISDRTYETGLDHGVLYFPPDPAQPTAYDDGVVWNGLINIDEQFDTGGNNANYFDGVKYLDSYDYGDFVATLSAFTYPDKFLEYEGMASLGIGLYVDDQHHKMFGMSYRTFISSSVQGVKAGYRIHLLYNLTVQENNYNYQNGSADPQPVDFQWTLYGRPEALPNFKPTTHIILDSRYLEPTLLKTLEDILYGTDPYYLIIDGGTPPSAGEGEYDGGTVAFDPLEPPFIIDGNRTPSTPGQNPRLPSLDELIGMVIVWAPRDIVPAIDTGLSPLVPGLGDFTPTKIEGIYAALPGTDLTQSPFDGIFYLGGVL